MRPAAFISPNQRELKSTRVFSRIQDLEDLFLVGLRIGRDLLARQRRARGVAAGRIADHSGEIADQERDLVTERLELAHLVDEHRVPEMQVGRGRIEARLDAQRLAARQLLHELALDEHFAGPAQQFGNLILHFRVHFPVSCDGRFTRDSQSFRYGDHIPRSHRIDPLSIRGLRCIDRADLHQVRSPGTVDPQRLDPAGWAAPHRRGAGERAARVRAAGAAARKAQPAPAASEPIAPAPERGEPCVSRPSKWSSTATTRWTSCSAASS